MRDTVYANYQAFGGTLARDQFERHLAVFFRLTQEACTGGDELISSEAALKAWEVYCNGAKIKNDVNRIFKAVDKFSAYT